ncbi:MAG: hypothetical protein RL011_1452 [Pseudomonadota bacterium]
MASYDYSTLLTKKLVIITGKGGIGKSLIAAALGQMVAESGRRVLIVQNAALDQVSPLFGFESAYDRLVTVQPRLGVLNIDSVANFRDYIVEHLGQRRLYDTVFSNRVVKSLINAVPGWADVMLLGRLLFECELRPQHDLVIFDGPASGHFLNLMTTPDSVLGMSLGGPLAKETQRVKAFLSDKSKCCSVLVTVPEELVVSECLDFLPRLHAVSPVALAGVFLNKTVTDQVKLTGTSPATEYARRTIAAAAEATAMLHEGIRAASPSLTELPIWSLPDLGFINEPLKAGFGEHLLTVANQSRSISGRS